MEITEEVGVSPDALADLVAVAGERPLSMERDASETSAALDALVMALESRWSARPDLGVLTRRLQELERCLRKDPDEVVAEYVDDPTFAFAAIACRLQRMHRDRLRLAEQCQALEIALEERPLWQLDGAIHALIDSAREICDAESQLVFEAYWLDLGVGD